MLLMLKSLSIALIVDSVRYKDSTVLVLDADGNVKLKEVWHDRDHYHAEKDSTAYYKLLWHEALQQQISSQSHDKQEKEVIVKQMSFWDKAKVASVGIATGFAIAIIVALIIIRYIRRKNNPP